MDRRILASILLIIFLILAFTGIIMFFTGFSKKVVAVHTVMGLLTVFFILFHFLNNKRVLSLYFSGKGLKLKKRLHPWILTLLIVFVSLAIYKDLPGFNVIYNWGNEFRNKSIGKEEQTFDYQIISLKDTLSNYKITLEAKKGAAFRYPLVAFWLGDSAGNYIQTLYISRSMSSSVYKNVFDGKNWKKGTVRRPEALPIWAHQRNIIASDGLYIPLGEAMDLDGVSGATPNSNFILSTSANIDSMPEFTVFLEVNQSFDWNEFYTKERFPNDSIYSGSGKVGQPSLLYSRKISRSELNSQKYFFLYLKGHGHHSGKTGKTYTQMDSITTAGQILDRVICVVETK